MRSDSAGASHDFVTACIERNIEVSVGMPVEGRVRDALLLVQEEDSVRQSRRTARSETVPGSPN